MIDNDRGDLANLIVITMPKSKDSGSSALLEAG